jgi:DNA-binding NarL/FixJ family response regulator
VKTIFLAEGERHVLDALRLLLEEQGEFKILDEAQSAEMLLTKVGKAAPDIILLDWSLPGIHHQRLVRALRACCPDVKLAAMSVRPEDEKNVLEHNLDGFIPKQLPPDTFLALLKAILAEKKGLNR